MGHRSGYRSHVTGHKNSSNFLIYRRSSFFLEGGQGGGLAYFLTILFIQYHLNLNTFLIRLSSSLCLAMLKMPTSMQCPPCSTGMGHPLGMAPYAEAPHPVGFIRSVGFIPALLVNSLPTMAH